MELFEKVDSVAHYNYQDSNRGPLNFVKIRGSCWGPTNGDLLGEAVISDLVIFHLRKKIIRLEKGFKLPEINSL
jgi:hypothetical protein